MKTFHVHPHLMKVKCIRKFENLKISLKIFCEYGPLCLRDKKRKQCIQILLTALFVLCKPKYEEHKSKKGLECLKIIIKHGPC